MLGETRRTHWSPRDRQIGFAVTGVIMVAVCAELVRAGVSITRVDLASSWQLIDLPVLERDPFGSVWYLHTQPPLHNLLIGSILRWSPVPPLGLIFVLYLASLVGAALLFTDVLSKWNVRPWVAGLISGLCFANPNLLSTIGIASYEVPVAFLMMAVLWWFQRYLQQPGWGPLIGLSATLGVLVMTRSLFHPAFALAVVALAVIARRATWRQIGAGLAIPLVLAGGWMLKNQVVFSTPTMSSWFGFNLQRGVTATLPRTDVERAVADGRVSPLALEYPWLSLSEYGSQAGCTPRHGHPAVASPWKRQVSAFRYPNLNDECYLPLYADSQANAETLVRDDPGAYLASRRQVLMSSFAVSDVGAGGGRIMGTGKLAPHRTWMDRTLGRLLLPVTTHVRIAGWNLPLYKGVDSLAIRVSPVLALLAVGVALRALVAGVRLARSGWRDRATSWSTDELLWLLAGGYLLVVVVVADLLEFGENGRFRSSMDPILVGLPLAALARIVAAHGDRRVPPAPDATPPP